MQLHECLPFHFPICPNAIHFAEIQPYSLKQFMSSRDIFPEEHQKQDQANAHQTLKSPKSKIKMKQQKRGDP